MAGTLIVSDTGALISFEKIKGGYNLAKKITPELLIPQAVYDEINVPYVRDGKDFLKVHKIQDWLKIVEAKKGFIAKIPKNIGLHKGEIEAMALALENKCPLLIEEKTGRSIAKYELNLKIIGSAGFLFWGFKQGKLNKDEIQTALRELVKAKRITSQVHSDILTQF